MKKTIILLLLAVGFSNCEISVHPVTAVASQVMPNPQLHDDWNPGSTDGLYKYDFACSDMRYRVITVMNNGVSVINLTRDSLECTYYRQRIENESSMK